MLKKPVVSQHVNQNKIETHFFFAYSFCGSLGLTTNLSLSTFFRIDSFVGKFIKVISASGFTTNFFIVYPMEATNKGFTTNLHLQSALHTA
jgi:hypothetical protein